MASNEKQGLLMGWIVPLLGLSLVAGAGGAFVGLQIVSLVKAGPADKSAQADAAPVSKVDGAMVRELAPIVTNLAQPDGGLVRLQTAIVYDKNDASKIDMVAAQIGDDILAFVKTLTVAQLQGATGVQHLREDLNERAATRSDGHVRELMIETLVVQ